MAANRDSRSVSEGLDAAALTRLATNYLARYAASTHRLRQVLERRVRRWHMQRDLPLPDDMRQMVDGTVARLVELGLVDDRAFAVGKARSLVRKGLPRDRIRAMLQAAGLDARATDVETVLGDDEAAQARRFAARRHLGPYRTRDQVLFRDKDIRSLMRAGFSFRIAAATVDAEPSH